MSRSRLRFSWSEDPDEVVGTAFGYSEEHALRSFANDVGIGPLEPKRNEAGRWTLETDVAVLAVKPRPRPAVESAPAADPPASLATLFSPGALVADLDDSDFSELVEIVGEQAVMRGWKNEVWCRVLGAAPFGERIRSMLDRAKVVADADLAYWDAADTPNPTPCQTHSSGALHGQVDGLRAALAVVEGDADPAGHLDLAGAGAAGPDRHDCSPDEDDLEYVAAPGYGQAWKCRTCGRPWVKVGAAFYPADEQVFELDPEDCR